MKILFTICSFILFINSLFAQQASDYFPSQTGYNWNYKVVVLDSLNNPIPETTIYRIDSFAVAQNYKGRLANVVPTKTGPIETIKMQPYLDTSFYNMDGANGFAYFRIGALEPFLIQLDSLGIAPNFSFLQFFSSLQNWYSYYRFASPVNSEYNLIQKDTTINISGTDYYLRFQYDARRLQDETIQTVLGDLNCKKFLLNWKILYYLLPPPFPGIELIRTNDTVWIAPGSWIVKDLIPANNIDLSFLGIPPFTIPGLWTEVTDEITKVEDQLLGPNTILLSQNYPNPFNPVTHIEYRIADNEFVTLKVFDILGNEIAILVNEIKPAGNYRVEFSAVSGQNGEIRNLTSGIYFYRLQTESQTHTKKMILLK